MYDILGIAVVLVPSVMRPLSPKNDCRCMFTLLAAAAAAWLITDAAAARLMHL